MMDQPSYALLQLIESRNRVRREQIVSALSDFHPSTDDICICSFPKSGSTWLQQICHALRVAAEAHEESDIGEEIPFLDLVWLTRQDLSFRGAPPPRLFKSHLPWEDVPKGMRYVYCIRDPLDVVVSYYNFQNGDLFETDTIGINEYAAHCFLENPGVWGTYWSHVRGWWKIRHRPDVLFLSYESLTRDLMGLIRRIARFMHLPPDELRDARACLASSKHAMLEQSDRRFGGNPAMVAALGQAMARPNLQVRSIVRPDGKGIRRAALSDATLELLQRMWERELAGPLDLPSYGALLSALADALPRAEDP